MHILGMAAVAMLCSAYWSNAYRRYDFKRWFRRHIFNRRRKLPPVFSNYEMHMWDECGQSVAEYATLLAVILIVVIGTIRLVGVNANGVFSAVSSSMGTISN